MQNPIVAEAESTNLQEVTYSYQGRVWRRFWKSPLTIAGIAGLLFLVLFSFVGPLIYRVNPLAINLAHMMQPPSAQFPLGTDDLGRNYLSRVMVGGQSSLIVGFASAVVSMAFGTLYGMVSGMASRWVDTIMMRIVDIILSIPGLFILLFLDAVFKPSVFIMVLILAATSWLSVARLVRAEVLSLKTRTYVEAAQALGASNWRIMLRYLFPNFLGTVLVAGTFSVAISILSVATLSFLGLGLPPPAPNWGAELSSAMNYMFQNSWWLTYPPGLAILLAELSINFIGDGLRQAFDSRM
ncbi:ABC transporter permease [Sulfobacillus harzensis]|uniref:ABC transporter permease n=1 Tax=Sulfobacillus harzensis TaxID=2729629 RepID=A0A7Y0Q1P2_9FIRM|nr:ABC transporter permease [Sulfobacillus harzensis]NMP22293.1 ABC transporter permease [Sulfobacillus harzensis]